MDEKVWVNPYKKKTSFDLNLLQPVTQSTYLATSTTESKVYNRALCPLLTFISATSDKPPTENR